LAAHFGSRPLRSGSFQFISGSRQFMPAYFTLLRPIRAYSGLFLRISSYLCLRKPAICPGKPGLKFVFSEDNVLIMFLFVMQA
jgi:hypothetical protein